MQLDRSPLFPRRRVPDVVDTTVVVLIAAFVAANIVQAPLLVTALLFYASALCAAFALAGEVRASDSWRTERLAPWSALLVFSLFSAVSIAANYVGTERCETLTLTVTSCSFRYVAVSMWVAFVLLLGFFLVRPISAALVEALVVIVGLAIVFVVLRVAVSFGLEGTDQHVGSDGRLRLSFGAGSTGNPNNLAVFLVFFAAAVVSGKWHSKAGRIVVPPAAGAACVLVGLTHSYAAAGALIIAIFVLVLVDHSKSTVRYSASLLSLVLGGLLLATFLSDATGLKTASAGARRRIWIEYLEVFADAPIVGQGMADVTSVRALGSSGREMIYYFAHSVPLHILVQGGIVGFVLYSWVVSTSASRALALARQGVTYPLVLGTAMFAIGLVQKGPILAPPGATTMLVLGPAIALVAAVAARPR